MIEKARRNALALRLGSGLAAPQHDTMTAPALCGSNGVGPPPDRNLLWRSLLARPLHEPRKPSGTYFKIVNTFRVLDV